MWKNNRRRHTERISTSEITHKYGQDYKLIFVGDATMRPYEIAYPGGSVEHWNEEAGAIWIKRMLLGGFIVNIIYISIMLLQPELSILVNALISGTLTGLIILFLIRKEYI